MRWRKLLWILAALAVLVLLGLGIAYAWLTHSGRPKRSGEAVIAGLSAGAEARFDRWGVPHVTAASARDAAAALGYLHANDRMTQMELGRRAASGRLAEIVGEAALPLDREALTLRLRKAAEDLWQASGAESRETLEAYAAGVNAWLTERGGDLPPGLRLLGIEPAPWEPVDSLCFAMLMARDLSFWQDRPEEERFRWLAAFGPEGVRALLGDPDLHVPDEILALAGRVPSSAPPAQLAPGAADGPATTESSPGSNNWVVGASRSASGSPLVANDPHLPMRLPGTWFQVLLRAPDMEVAGMTLPGLPGVVIGRTRHLAWGLTNVMLDDHDLFFEELDEAGERVRRGDGWQPIDVETVLIPVKGADPVPLELRTTDRGPLLPADPDRGLPARSMAWTGLLPADPLAAFTHLAHSRRVEEVPAGLASYAVPAQNLVVADSAGGLLYVALGRVPDRLRGDGRLPSPGWDPAYGWDGLRPALTNPMLLRPEDDLLVTANNDVRPRGYDLPLPADFDTPHRADRIRQLLLARPAWTAADQAAVQADIVSLYALQVIELLGGETYSGEADRAYRVLSQWDGSMIERGPAALFTLLEVELRRAVFADEAAAHGLPPLDSRSRLLRVLSGAIPPGWFDDVSTPEVEDRALIQSRSLESALQAARARWGDAPDTWDYGHLHPLHLRHPMGRLPFLGRFYNLGRFPMPGSSTTVAAFGGAWRNGAVPVTYGPSMRWVADLADPDAGLAVLPGGQSGHPWDPHYGDQLPLYLEGHLRPVPWTDEAIQAATETTLHLHP